MAGEGLKDLLIKALERGHAEGRALQTPRAPMLPDYMTPDGRFRLPSAGFSEIASSAPDRSWGVVKPYAVPSVAQPPFDMLDDAAKEAVYSGIQKTPMTPRVPIQSLLDGIDDTMIRAAAPAAESATSGAFSSFQPGSASWRSMAQPMTSPWEGSVPMPKDPLAEGPAKVWPKWNAPYGYGSGPIGDGTKISSRVNLLGNATKPLADFDPTAAIRGGLDDAAQAGASVADDVGATAIRAAPSVVSAAAPAIEAEAPALASAASRGMLGHTLDGLKALNLPWGKIALGGAALGGAAKLLGSLGQIPGYIIPNQMGEGGLGGDGISVESLDPEVNPQLSGLRPASDPSGLSAALPSPEELPGMPEEPEMSMDGDEPPPVTHTAPLEASSDGLRTIQKGDTLSALLLGMGVPRADLPRVIGEIARGNGIVNADQIMPGQQIDMNKRVAGENYRWMPTQFGGPVSSDPMDARGAATPDPLLEGLTSSGGYKANNYDAIMGPGRRPAPSVGSRYQAHGDLPIPSPQFRRRPL